MRTEVLDYGYVELVEYWGSEERIIEAARMSTGKGFKGWAGDTMFECPVHGPLEGDYRRGEIATDGDSGICTKCLGEPLPVRQREVGDEKLLRYLYAHHHTSPFEMAGMIIEIQAPIMVFREWHRHRTQSYNEMSARYTPLPDVNYMPSFDRLLMNGGANKQAASTGKQLTKAMAGWFREQLSHAYFDDEQLYQAALAEGVPKELARLMLPVGRYSRMRASANLKNWLDFMTLRCSDKAQYEIRVYANEIKNLLLAQFPRTTAFWEEEFKHER